MLQYLLLLFLTWTLLVDCSPSIVREQSPVAPNIIIVFADDLGIGDTTPTNGKSKINTLNLQQMASEGITFHDAHSTSSVCTPSRYGLLTGRYSFRSHLDRGVINGTSSPLISSNRSTLANLLKAAGYKTAMMGKWHLGIN